MGFHNTKRDESVFPWNSTGNIYEFSSTKKAVCLQGGKVQILGLYFAGNVP